MPMFDYRGRDGRALIADALKLSVFYNTGAAPTGWRKLTAAELGIPESKVDEQGQFTGDGTVDGQALVLGKFDGAGKLVGLSIAYTATNGAGDVADCSKLDDDSYAFAFDYMIEAVRQHAVANRVGGSDVIVTGYSLGAGAANTHAAHRLDSWGGFFADSQYIGFAVPKVTEDLRVFNFGVENDVVHRVVGEGNKDANAGSPTHRIAHNDGPYATTTDNIVLFNDTYANPLFPVVPFVLANLPEGWSAHLDMAEFDIVGLIGGSTWYEGIERDSTVVISYMSDSVRQATWLEDKKTSTSDHFGSLAFLLGSEQADRVRDGTADDFIDGFGGNDLIRLSGGNDAVAGGSGTDTVILAGGSAGRSFYRLSDGTVFALDRAGAGGLDELRSVERLQMGENLLGGGPTYVVERTGLRLEGGTARVAYALHREGGAGADRMAGTTRADALFGRDGDDQLSGGNGDDLLVGGAGRDALYGGLGGDRLFGGSGDDLLVAQGGQDTLSGGIGSDLFEFRQGLIGDVVITDFDMGEQGDDRLRFSRLDFSDFADIVDSARELAGDLLIEGARGSVRLVGVTFDEFTATDVLLVG